MELRIFFIQRLLFTVKLTFVLSRQWFLQLAQDLNQILVPEVVKYEVPKQVRQEEPNLILIEKFLIN